MPFNDGPEVNASKNITVENEDGLVDSRACELYSSSRAKGMWFDHVANGQSDLVAASNSLLDAVGLVIQAQNNFVDFCHLTDQIDLVVEKLTKIGTIGLGVSSVSGLSLVPNPPAKMTAFMSAGL